MKLSKEKRLEKALYNWIDANDIVEEDIKSILTHEVYEANAYKTEQN